MKVIALTNLNDSTTNRTTGKESEFPGKFHPRGASAPDFEQGRAKSPIRESLLPEWKKKLIRICVRKVRVERRAL